MSTNRLMTFELLDRMEQLLSEAKAIPLTKKFMLDKEEFSSLMRRLEESGRQLMIGAIARAIANQSRDIRLPVHLTEQINRINRAQRTLMQELGRDPTVEEIAAQFEGMTPQRVQELQKLALDPVSLETPAGDEETSTLGDFVQDENAISPEMYAENEVIREQVDKMLKELPEREEQIIRMRFGLDGTGRQKTLEEVGRNWNVTRERIRQLEAKALRRLQMQLKMKKEYRDLKD